MYGPLIVAAAILLSIAGLVLFLHDLAEARSRKAIRPHLRGGQAAPLSGPGFTAVGRTVAPVRKTPTRGRSRRQASHRAPGRPTAL
jgi:hypothetical protein